MLLELRVGQLALVDEIIITLGRGLTILTGETGAGKSLIAGALNLLCGGKADKDLVRQGEQAGYVEGLFDLGKRPDLREEFSRMGVRIGSDGILVLRRELRRAGRSRVMINGLVSSLALLERLGPLLIAVQTQDQQRELDDPGYALRFLDSQIGTEKQLEEYRICLNEYKTWRDNLSERKQEEALAIEQLDIWRYQLKELQEADLHQGEEEELSETLTLLRHAGALHDGAARAWQFLSEGEAPVRELLGECISVLQEVATKSQQLDQVLQSLLSAEESVAEAAVALNRFLDRLDLDPGDLQDYEARQALYAELQRKYQMDTAGLLDLQRTLDHRIGRQEAAASDLEDLTAEVARWQTRLQVAAQDLHAVRTSKAATVARAATRIIRSLALPHLELEFESIPLAEDSGPVLLDGITCRLTENGAERVEMKVRTNPGERMGPIGRIASGGERSRIHLGLTALNENVDTAPLMLFDEADAGLGMDAATPVAVLLRDLARRGQVLCITHLPTMAVYGTTHLLVTKNVGEGRAQLAIQQLDDQQRITEIARLLGGEGWGTDDLDSQRQYARELLNTAKLAKLAAENN